MLTFYKIIAKGTVPQQGFIQDSLLGGGGGGLFWNSKIDIKHTFLGGSGGCLPENV